MVVALFLENCSLLDPRIYRHQIFGGFYRRTKQPAQIRRTETRYWAVYFKRHCSKSSPGLIKHKEKSERGGHFQHRTPFCLIYLNLWQTEHMTGMGCVTSRYSKVISDPSFKHIPIFALLTTTQNNPIACNNQAGRKDGLIIFVTLTSVLRNSGYHISDSVPRVKFKYKHCQNPEWSRLFNDVLSTMQIIQSDSKG